MSDETENQENPESQEAEGTTAQESASPESDASAAAEGEAPPSESAADAEAGGESTPSMRDHMDDIMNGAGGGGLEPGLPDREFAEGGGFSSDRDLNAVYEVPVHLSAVLGKSTMPVNQLLKIGRGAVIELDRRVGEAIDIYVNNKLVARGEVVLVEDRLGVTMTEIIKADRV